jgi:hypothetical protein
VDIAGFGSKQEIDFGYIAVDSRVRSLAMATCKRLARAVKRTKMARLTLDCDTVDHSMFHGRPGRVIDLAGTGSVADMAGTVGSHTRRGPGMGTLPSYWDRILRCGLSQVRTRLCGRRDCFRARIRRRQPLCSVGFEKWVRAIWNGGVGVVQVGSEALAMFGHG